MARNLLKAGYELKVYDIIPEAVDALVAAGAIRGESNADAAAFGNIVITMVPNSPT